MAAGDILSVTILATGWEAEIEIDGLSTGGTYAFGNIDSSTSNAKIDFTVVSEGYNTAGTLGTITRHVYGTTQRRKQFNNSTNATCSVADERSNGSGGVIVTVALSDYIYDDDKNGGAGTSGTNPTVNISSGFYTQGSPNNSASAFAVTNNSTQDYPTVIGHWATVPYQCITASTFDIEAVVFHRFAQNGKPVAAVKFQDGVTTDVLVTAMVKSSQADSCPVYKRTLTMTDYTDNATITCDFIAYPWVGDANSLLNSSGTAGVQALGSLPFVADPDSDYNAYVAVVDSGSGNDGTGVASTTYATAAASPFATARAAMAAINTAHSGDAGGGFVYLKAGTHSTWGSGSVAASAAWVTVTRDPGALKSAVIITSTGAGQYTGAEKLRLYDLTIAPTASTYIGGSSTSYRLWVDSVTIAAASQVTVQIAGEFGYVWATHCTSSKVSKPIWCDNGVNHLPVLVRGCTVTDCTHATTVSSGQGPTVALTNSFTFTTSSVRFTTLDRANTVLAYNKVYKFDGNTSQPIVSGSAAISHVAVVCNVFEQITNENLAVSLWSDSVTNACHNILFWHNTLAGRRTNAFYNDVLNTSTSRTNISLKYNSVQSFRIKQDYYVGAVNGASASGLEKGAWATNYMVGCIGNHMEDAATPGTDPQQMPYYTNGTTAFLMGMRSTRGTAAGYASDLSYTNSGAGGGAYTITTSSTLRSKIPSSSEILIPYDIAGNAYVDAAGAYEFVNTGLLIAERTVLDYTF